MNACTWIPNLVTLVDGRQVDCSSEEWRLECECRYILAKPFTVRKPGETTRAMLLEQIGQRRGPEALEALKEAIHGIEPAYVLSLPNKAQRNAYLDQIGHHYGENAASHLKTRTVALHKARTESNCASTAA